MINKSKMYNPLLFSNHIHFLLIKSGLIDMTINNPLFIFSVITIIWFIPGILVRKISQRKQEAKKKKIQSEAIGRLYPKD